MKLAVFDLDDTLYNGCALVESAAYLLERDLIDRTAYEKIVEIDESRKRDPTIYENTGERIVNALGEGIRNKSHMEVLQASRQFFLKLKVFFHSLKALWI